MVKVFPSSFSFVEKQKILTSVSGEPLCIECSDECLFVAEEDCLLEVFSLETLQPLGKFRTVSPVLELVYNVKGDCIVTLERKDSASQGFARVYFKWRGASVDKPMRISLLNSLSHNIMLPKDNLEAAEIIELPGEFNSPVTCLACCKESGRIAVGMNTTLRIFTLTTEYTETKEGVSSDDGSVMSSSVSHESDSKRALSHSIDILLDIQTNLPLHRLSIFCDYLAFISTLEARVLKLSLLVEPTLPVHSISLLEEPHTSCSPGRWSYKEVSQIESISKDKDFVKWSPSRVWEEEKAANSLPGSTTGSLVDISLPNGRQRSKSRDSCTPSPIIGTLSLPSVTNSTSKKTADKHAMEVLGPVEYIWGQPIKVLIEQSGNRATPTSCRVLTMLYRRFPPMKNDEESLVKSVPLSAKKEALAGLHTAGLHTVQLLPIVTTDDSGGRQLIGITCFLANKSHGFLYDVHLQGHLAASFSFMSPTRAIVCDATFFHALSAESVETYTSRSLQAAIQHMPMDSSLTEWLQKPSPSPSMDLTLISANQFVSSYCIASSQDYMVVLTKSPDRVQWSSTTSWILQSLAMKKPAESSWNIYVLQKKDPIAMYQQFNDLSSLMKDSSPPMYYHLLCEGHNLLRSQILLNSRLSTHLRLQLVSSLQENCLALAQSLCQYSIGKATVTSAARYFILSKNTIQTIMDTTLVKFTRKLSLPYSILIKFLDLVVFDRKYRDESLSEGKADTILELYAEFQPKSLPPLLLESWLKEYLSPGTTYQAVTSYLQSKALNDHQISLGRLCEVLLLLQLNQEQEASVKLKELSNTFLREWILHNITYLVEGDSRLTKLGMLLLKIKESCLLDILFQFLTSGELGLEVTSTLLQPGGRDDHSIAKEQQATNLPLKHFLDGIALDKVKGLSPEAKQRALISLADLLIARLTVETTPPSSSTPFSLYGSRYKWLDSLPPFDGSTPKPPQVVLQDLMQLQALLSSCHLTANISPAGLVVEVAQHVDSSLVEGMVGELSLRLLSWPHTGKTDQAVELVFNSKASITVDYTRTFLPPILSHWKGVLDLLLKSCMSASSEREASQQETDPFLSLYRAALSHVVSFCSPEELLGLLPPSGSVSFYLPFIEKSCKLQLSRELAHHLYTTNRSQH